MCKHSKEKVNTLAKRQRGLDARGNDPLATRRESSWAAEFIRNPPGDSLDLTLDYLKNLPVKVGNKNIIGTAGFKQKLDLLGENPDGLAFADFFANPQSGFKGLMDEIGNPMADNFPELHNQAREQPFFKKRGRNEQTPRFRRQSMDSRHVGISTSMDRTSDTEDLYQNDYFHAKGQFRPRMGDETVKQFQKSGAPFIAGASGTMQYVAMQMETVKSFDELEPEELQDREKVLTMLSVQHVAAGHHSMSECLLGVKSYGYFKDIPDPLIDYDGAMKAFEKHLGSLGLGGGQQPLSRDSENKAKDKDQVKYEDRRAFVKTYGERFADQIAPRDWDGIQQFMTNAADAAGRGEYKAALGLLAKAENLISAQASLIEAKARGNNHVLRSDELIEKMRGASRGGKSQSTEYKAVTEGLAKYERSMKQLAGRKLDHDRVGLAFDELRAQLETVEKAANAYNAKQQNKESRTGRRDIMTDLIAKIATEKALLEQAEREIDDHNLLGDLTIEQAVEYARFGIKVGTQVAPNVLNESDITGKKVLGSGGINTVMLIDYKTGDEEDTKQYAFKPEKQDITTHTDMLQDQGIDPKKPRFGKRNIASKKMATAAGLGGLIPEATFTTVDGKVGLAMQKAEGEAPIKRDMVEFPNPGDHPDLQDAYEARERDPNSDWKTKIPPKNSSGMRYGYDDEAGKFTVEKLRTGEFSLTAPPGDAKKVAAGQQQLVNLQWLDAICGQVDRHAENYVIDTTQDQPTIMGVDNDFAFGKNRGTEQKSQNTLGLPPIVDQATFDKLMQMVQNWPNIARSLADELDDQEIAAAKARLDAVEHELEELKKKGMVVQSWDEKVQGRSITEILMDPTSPDTYYKRDAGYQQFVRG